MMKEDTSEKWLEINALKVLFSGCEESTKKKIDITVTNLESSQQGNSTLTSFNPCKIQLGSKKTP
jgi:hypothetical protein